MIDITLRSGTYSFKELDGKLSNYLDDKTDRDIFLRSMLTTDQISKSDERYILPIGISKEFKRPQYVNLVPYSYAGKGRVGVRVGKDFVDRYGYPTEMYISKIMINGKMVNVKEKPRLRIVKGRYPNTIEAWRAEIPASIRNKYKIQPESVIRIAVKSVTYEYFTRLRLFGFKYRVMLMYGETKDKKNIRDLELDGQGFVKEVERDIKVSISNHQKKITGLVEELLHKADLEYYGLYMESKNAGKVSDNIEATPLVDDIGVTPFVEFRDIASRRIIADWQSDKEGIPEPDDFKMNLNINMGLKDARGQTKLSLRWENKGGFK